jgi:hypothetical protein
MIAERQAPVRPGSADEAGSSHAYRLGRRASCSLSGRRAIEPTAYLLRYGSLANLNSEEHTMSHPKPDGKSAATEGTGARVYDTATPATAKNSGPGVYDAPSRASGLPIGMIVGVVVGVLIIAFLLFQFVF